MKNPVRHSLRPLNVRDETYAGDGRSRRRTVFGRFRFAPPRFETAVLLLSGVFLSCQENPLSTTDLSSGVPFAHSLIITPSTIDLRSIPPANGVYQISFVVRTTVQTPPGGSGAVSVFADLLRAGSGNLVISTPLRDDGVAPDSAARDGRYSGMLSFGAFRADAGAFRVRVRGVGDSGMEGNRIEALFDLTRNNAPPALSQLTAPDTVALPAGGSILIPMTVAVQDSDGLEDVREVFFRSLDSSDPDQKFFLRDDGGTDPSSGDQTADDGVYSIVVQLRDGPAVRRTFRFAFQAADAFGDTSGTLLHYLTVR